MTMKAAEYFAQVSRYAEDLRRCCETLEELDSDGLHGISYDHLRSPSNIDSYARESRLDYRAKLESRMKSDRLAIAEACMLLYGRDGKGGLSKLKGRNSADVIYMRHIRGMSWRAIAKESDCSVSTCRYYQRKAFEFIDTHGVARVREG